MGKVLRIVLVGVTVDFARIAGELLKHGYCEWVIFDGETLALHESVAQRDEVMARGQPCKLPTNIP